MFIVPHNYIHIVIVVFGLLKISCLYVLANFCGLFMVVAMFLLRPRKDKRRHILHINGLEYNFTHHSVIAV